MEIKKKNEIVALMIVTLVAITGFFMIFLFYSIISPINVKKEEAKNSLEIKDNVLEKITGQSSSTQLLLEDSDLGRENPFEQIR
jgi:hypothetical protein